MVVEIGQTGRDHSQNVRPNRELPLRSRSNAPVASDVVQGLDPAVQRLGEGAGQVGAVRERTPAAAPKPETAGSSEQSHGLRPPGLLELEELLARHLDTRVKIEMGATKGRVLIEFATLEDLERIYRAMTEPQAASVSS